MEICSTHRAEDVVDYKKTLSKYDNVIVKDEYRRYSSEKSLLESIIPSKDMREYHNKIGYEYSDFAIAAMITWSDMPFFRKIDELTVSIEYNSKLMTTLNQKKNSCIQTSSGTGK